MELIGTVYPYVRPKIYYKVYLYSRKTILKGSNC